MDICLITQGRVMHGQLNHRWRVICNFFFPIKVGEQKFTNSSDIKGGHGNPLFLFSGPWNPLCLSYLITPRGVIKEAPLSLCGLQIALSRLLIDFVGCLYRGSGAAAATCCVLLINWTHTEQKTVNRRANLAQSGAHLGWRGFIENINSINSIEAATERK